MEGADRSGRGRDIRLEGNSQLRLEMRELQGGSKLVSSKARGGLGKCLHFKSIAENGPLFRCLHVLLTPLTLLHVARRTILSICLDMALFAQLLPILPYPPPACSAT
jgi:hypothetical protein